MDVQAVSALLAALLILYAGAHYENLVWDQLNGRVAGPVLLASGVVMLAAGYRGYVQKEAGPAAPRIQWPARWGLWTVLFVLGLAIASAVLLTLNRHFPNLLLP